MAAHILTVNLTAKQEVRLATAVQENNARRLTDGLPVQTADEFLLDLLVRQLRAISQKIQEREANRVGEKYDAANASTQAQVDTLLGLP